MEGLSGGAHAEGKFVLRVERTSRGSYGIMHEPLNVPGSRATTPRV